MKLRFPYFYQLMLIFFTVIFTLMVIPFFVLIHFGRTQLLDEVETDFFEYAELVYEAEKNSDIEKLNAYREILESRSVEYGIYNEDGVLKYPKNEQELQVNLDQEDVETLKSNKNVSLRMHENDLFRNKKDTALVYAPIFNQKDEYQGFIGVGWPFKYIETAVKEIKLKIFKVFLIATLIAIFISVAFSYLMVKRINNLSKASQKVATGNYDIYIDHSNRDEIDRLSVDFNKMIKALKQWRKEVLLSEEKRKNFMQDAIHEMRTPLTTINGLLEGLEYKIFDEKQEERSIKIMKKETNRLIRLVNENLDYENIQSNRIILRKQHFLLDDAIIEIYEQLSPIVNETNVEIKIKDSLKNISIYADFDRFKQILVNLLKNAIQFTNDGTIVVEAFEDNKNTIITIMDNGIGMSEDQLENIWDRYYKADPSRKNTKYGESGLGLPIVKRLIELHDGSIEVESELGQGSKFVLMFPKRKNNKNP